MSADPQGAGTSDDEEDADVWASADDESLSGSSACGDAPSTSEEAGGGGRGDAAVLLTSRRALNEALEEIAALRADLRIAHAKLAPAASFAPPDRGPGVRRGPAAGRVHDVVAAAREARREAAALAAAADARNAAADATRDALESEVRALAVRGGNPSAQPSEGGGSAGGGAASWARERRLLLQDVQRLSTLYYKDKLRMAARINEATQLLATRRVVGRPRNTSSPLRTSTLHTTNGGLVAPRVVRASTPTMQRSWDAAMGTPTTARRARVSTLGRALEMRSPFTPGVE